MPLPDVLCISSRNLLVQNHPLMQNHRAHPHIAIPQRARSPAYYGPSSTAEVSSPYPFELGSEQSDSLLSASWEPTPTARRPPSSFDVPGRTRTRTRSTFGSPSPSIAFPQPDIYRSASHSSTLHPRYHRSSKSEAGSSGRMSEDALSLSRSHTPATPASTSSIDLLTHTTDGVRSYLHACADVLTMLHLLARHQAQ